jgi:aminopeptidase YwaD
MHDPSELIEKAGQYLDILCHTIPQRSVGSNGNIEATDFFEKTISALDWETFSSEFPAMDWQDGGAELRCGEQLYEVFASPYSNGCDCTATLCAAGNLAELESVDAREKVLLIHGQLAREQLMPKNFVFYNPESHQKIISLLESSGAKALITATGRNAALAGGVYPFPLIEDGDFDIPSVYMTEETGAGLLPRVGKTVSLKSGARRIPSKGYNIKAIKGSKNKPRIVITAHIDAKKGTPGAIDNATGVCILLLLAELLQDYEGDRQLEIVAFNGEDYYAVPGQMKYIEENQGDFDSVDLNINIDGAGYREGPSAFSLFNLPARYKASLLKLIGQSPGLTEGKQWVQGDHSIFVQFGRPALAVSSEWFVNNVDSQDITHTEKDNPDIVDPSKLVEIAEALSTFIRDISQPGSVLRSLR